MGPIEAKFYVKPPWEGEGGICLNGPDHMTMIAAMPIYGKTFKNLFLCSTFADVLETWYTALGTRILPSLFK